MYVTYHHTNTTYNISNYSGKKQHCSYICEAAMLVLVVLIDLLSKRL
jgi:hypothetical protein